MGQHFDDYSGFQQIPGMPILLQQSVSCKFCSTTFGMAKLSHHILTVHLNQHPEIRRASPNCANYKANSVGKRRFEIDLNSSKKMNIDSSFSLEGFCSRFPTLEEKICNQLDQLSHGLLNIWTELLSFFFS